MKRKTMISSILVIVLCLGLISGSTFALFTSENSVNIAVTSGKVKVNATLSTPILYSANASEITTDGKAVKTTDTTSDGADGTLTGTFAGTYYYDKLDGTTFADGGTASYTAPTLTIDKMTPGDKVKTTLSVGNESNVAIQYRLKIEATSTSNLDVLSLLKIDYDGKLYTGLKSFTSSWTLVPAPTSTTDPMTTKDISIIFPLDVDGEEYMDKTVGFVFTVEAVQSNANTSGTTTIEFATSAGTSTATAQTLTATAVIPTTANATVITSNTATTDINDTNNDATTSIPVSTTLYTDDAGTGSSITAGDGTTGALSRTIDVVPTSPTSVTVDISFTYTETNTTTQESTTTAVTGFDKIVTNTANIGVNLMSVTVTRSHNGQVTQMTESDDPTVEGFSYNPDTGVLTIRSKLYSEYCVNYKLAVAYNLNNTSESYLNVEQLHAALVAGKSVKLLSDLDMTGYTWEPIEGYTGTFDGNKKTISNLSISAPGDMGAMFYSVGDNTTIKDVKFADVSVEGKYVATVVADASEALNLTLTGIEVLSGSVTANSYAAGIAFDVEGAGITMTNCKNYATITSNFVGAGIATWVVSNSGTYNNLENYGDVTGAWTGGIFANFKGDISNSINKGDVTSTANYPAGGIVGVIAGVTNFDHCINIGDITNSYASSNPNASAGGIFGHTPGSATTANYCINTGNISSLNSVAGGIGTALYGGATINYSYNSGDVFGNRSTVQYTAGGIMPKPEYGNANSVANYSLNTGTITCGDNGSTYNVATLGSESYYYDNGVLKNHLSGDTVVDIQSVVTTLNGGTDDTSFWTINNNVIVPAILVEE